MNTIGLIVLIGCAYAIIALLHWYVLDRNGGKFSSLYAWLAAFWLPAWLLIGGFLLYAGISNMFRRRRSIR